MFSFIRHPSGGSLAYGIRHTRATHAAGFRCFVPDPLRVWCVLPAGLDHAGDLPGKGQQAEADTAQVKLADISTGTATAETTVPMAAFKLRFLFVLGDLRGSGHVFLIFVASAYWRNGIPRCFSSATPSASVLAVVVMQIFMPLTFSTLL